jgi:hypothetical protein
MPKKSEPMTTVVDDLDEQWAPVEAALLGSSAVVLPGRVTTSGPCVEYAGNLDVLLRILTELAPRIVYATALVWTEEMVNDFVALCHVMGQDDEDYPAELTAARHARTREHVGSLASVDVAVVADGVTHLWSLTAQWWEQTATDVHDLVEGVRAARNSDWEEQMAAQDAERERQEAYLDTLVDVLVADEKWLALANEKTRREHATQLARAAIGREACQEQRVRGRITGAVLTATQRRTDDILPERRQLAISQLPQMAADLAATPEYTAARTKSDRERLGRVLLQRVAPLVPPAELLTALLTQATPGRGYATPMLV